MDFVVRTLHVGKIEPLAFKEQGKCAMGSMHDELWMIRTTAGRVR